MLHEIERVPGIADARIQQAFDYPEFDVTVDRTKAAQGGYTQRDVANSLLNSLSGSFPNHPDVFSEFQERRQLQPGDSDSAIFDPSLEDLQNTPLNAGSCRAP